MTFSFKIRLQTAHDVQRQATTTKHAFQQLSRQKSIFKFDSCEECDKTNK